MKALDYLSDLSEKLVNTQVSDKSGKTKGLEQGIAEAVELLLSVRKKRSKVMLIGNGGSAAIANHVHNDLCKALRIRALTFYEAPVLTAYSNDHGYETAFEQLVSLWADEGDLLVAISSSGESKNILDAVQTANGRGCRVITLSGFSKGNSLRQAGHLNFYIDSTEYGFVESTHANITHCITDLTLQAGTQNSTGNLGEDEHFAIE